jgi:acyl-CoA thioesterase YciA
MSSNSSEKVSLPTDKELVLKVISMPGDSNANGDIFGGWVMARLSPRALPRGGLRRWR